MTALETTLVTIVLSDLNNPLPRPILHSHKREREREGGGGENNRIPGKIKRREVELDPQVSTEEIKSREVELGCESWAFFASSCYLTAVQRTLDLCPLPVHISS